MIIYVGRRQNYELYYTIPSPRVFVDYIHAWVEFCDSRRLSLPRDCGSWGFAYDTCRGGGAVLAPRVESTLTPNIELSFESTSSTDNTL